MFFLRQPKLTLKYEQSGEFPSNICHETAFSRHLNPLTPNDLHMSRTAPLTSKHCILYRVAQKNVYTLKDISASQERLCHLLSKNYKSACAIC